MTHVRRSLGNITLWIRIAECESMVEWHLHPSLTFNIFPIFPCKHQITRWGKIAIHPKFYNTIVQFAQVSNFSKVPLQSGLKSKHLSNHIDFKVTRWKKQWNLLFWKHVRGRCHTAQCQTACHKSMKVTVQKNATTLSGKCVCVNKKM